MNTKYPTNGRYATLGDIVQEYRDYATVDITDSSTISLMEYIGEQPYELVWFDNVYSNTEKDNEGKSMKIIQDDSSSNYDRYILASELQSNSNKVFTFYIVRALPCSIAKYNTISNIATSYYFNYKTSNGESTLLYTFNEIKNLADSSQLEDLFGTDIANNKDSTSFSFIKKLNNHKISTSTETYQGIAASAENESKKYINAGKNAKLYFYIQLYNETCRFVPGKLADLTLSKVTKITYKQNEPVYRCDIGVNDKITEFTVNNIYHDTATTLPAGKLSGSTEMKFTVQYAIQYEHASSISTGSYSFSLTFDTIKALTNDENSWKYVQFIPAGNTTAYRYGTDNFPYIETIKDENNNLTYGSLTNFLWAPPGNLLVETLLNVNNNGPENIESTANTEYLTANYEGTDTNYNPAIHKYFGSFRIHSAYKTTSEKDIQDTSFTKDVSIYRHKNYYIDESKTGGLSSSSIYIQLDPVYKETSFPQDWKPNIREELHTHTSEFEPNNIDYNYLVPYAVYDDTFSFISILSKVGKYRTFLSGTTQALEETSSQYINNLDCIIQSYSNTNNQWISTTNITLTPVNGTSNTENLYKLSVNNNSNNFTYFRIGFNEDDEYKYIYLKKSQMINNSNELKVKLFKTIDKYDDSLNLLAYNNNQNNNDYYNYSKIRFGGDGIINVYSFSNLYIQSSCIKSTSLFNNKWIYTVTDINKIYYAYKSKDDTYIYQVNDIFKPPIVPINNVIKDSKGYHLYISLSPIFIIYDETINDNIKITYTINDRKNTTIQNKGYDCISDGSNTLTITHINVIYSGDISTVSVKGIIKLNNENKDSFDFTNTTYDKDVNISLSTINRVLCTINKTDKTKTINITWNNDAGTVTSNSQTINNGQNTFTLSQLTNGITLAIKANDGHYLEKEQNDCNGTMEISDTISSYSSDTISYDFKEGYNITCICEKGTYKFSSYPNKSYTSIYTNSNNQSKITITPNEGYEIKQAQVTPTDGIKISCTAEGNNMIITISEITKNGTINVKCTEVSGSNSSTS